MPWGAIASVVSNFANMQFQDMTNRNEYRHFLENRQYNEPVNQVARLKAAGLNPVTALGGYQQSASPPSMTAPQIDAASLSNSFSNMQNRALRKDALDLQKQEFEIRKSINAIKLILLQKGIEEKDLNLAIKALTFDTQQQIQPFVIKQEESKSKIADNKAGMSALDFENYPSYLKGISDNLAARTNQSNQMAEYYKGKPARESFQNYTARLSQEEQARHNKEQERIAKNTARMSHQDRVKAINVAVKQYNLAVRKQNWDEAHYWYDLAVGAASTVAKIASKAAGLHFGLPIDKWW